VLRAALEGQEDKLDKVEGTDWNLDKLSRPAACGEDAAEEPPAAAEPPAEQLRRPPRQGHRRGAHPPPPHRRSKAAAHPGRPPPPRAPATVATKRLIGRWWPGPERRAEPAVQLAQLALCRSRPGRDQRAERCRRWLPDPAQQAPAVGAPAGAKSGCHQAAPMSVAALRQPL